LYSSPLYYLLLIVSATIFIIYVYSIFITKETKFDFFEYVDIDNNAYWEYNNKLYYAKIVNGKIDNNSVIAVDSHGITSKEAYEIMKGVKR
jgi:hypothetical protein